MAKPLSEFGKAFDEARRNNLPTFTYKGKTIRTNIEGQSPEEREAERTKKLKKITSEASEKYDTKQREASKMEEQAKLGKRLSARYGKGPDEEPGLEDVYPESLIGGAAALRGVQAARRAVAMGSKRALEKGTATRVAEEAAAKSKPAVPAVLKRGVNKLDEVPPETNLMRKGGMTRSGRGDGLARKGKTKGRMV